MAYLFNNPSDFADELIEGFTAANAQVVRQVPGGVVRRARAMPGHVAVIIGGGSGHYPAFAGLVGQGLAHGAAMGNLFASPSAQQVYSVARAAESGGGVLLTYGNYAGDVLNFTQAEERLKGEGIRCRTVLVTDDVSSAALEDIGKRRGVAGDLAVFKTAGVAADAGLGLDEVARIAEHANERTRSFGVAFSGCTLPGGNEPLFTVPNGRMAVGMGIHGEPGIDERDIPTADGLAELLVRRLLEEAPQDTVEVGRVGVILNGLGSVKYEELFVTYRRVAQLLSAAGLQIVDPEVGELVTSFEMAGVSLTLIWLDDELDGYWRASAYSAAFRKGAVEAAEMSADEGEDPERDDEPIPWASEASRAAAQLVAAALDAVRQTIDDNVDELGRLDSIAGDGDHGIGMQRGATAANVAALDALQRGAGAGTVLKRAGDAWAYRAGGTSGALWGVALNAIGARLGDDPKPDGAGMAGGIADARDSIMRFGKAEPGDKTLVDVLVPFSAALTDAVDRGVGLVEAWGRALVVADAAAEATASLRPKIGRARPLAEKSLGSPDPGAVSMAMIIRAVHEVLSSKGNQS
ncbi:MAG TPA: dihydroxyacetone kinase family protein [Acidimicrobiia bacterium]